MTTANTVAGIDGAAPTPGIGLSSFYGRWLERIDYGLTRSFPIREGKELGFEVQGFNLFTLCQDGQRALHFLSKRLIRLPRKLMLEPRKLVSGHKLEASRFSLGHLEFNVMEILWSVGESDVRDVRQRLNRPLAYTTVMTTLERLFRKSLLVRRKEGRAFLYSPRLSREEWERVRLEDLVTAFVDGSRPCRELLFSTLVDTVGQQDQTLLDALEKKIQSRRLELSKRNCR